MTRKKKLKKKIYDHLITNKSYSIIVGCDFDMRHHWGSRWDTSKLEFAKQIVVLDHGALALVRFDQEFRLVVEYSSLDTQRERSNVQEQKILNGFRLVGLENGRRDSGTVCDGLVGVDRLVQLAIEEVLEGLMDLFKLIFKKLSKKLSKK